MTDHPATAEPIPLLIDTDPGVDDALALMMAFASPEHRVVGLSIAAGNVGLDHTVGNALKLLDVLAADVPVFPGCPLPLLAPAPDASHVHGRDGFGDTGYLPSRRQPAAEHAANAIIRLSHVHAGRLVLIALGPLTNLALALRLDPSLPERLARIVIMGGAVRMQGNISPWAEFNLRFDPEAAAIVFDGLPRFDLVDWQAVLDHPFPRSDFERWLDFDSPAARFFTAISQRFRDQQSQQRGDHAHAADALAMAIALDPDAGLEWRSHRVRIALDGHARGASLVDWQQHDPSPANARILITCNRSRFAALVQRGLRYG